MTQAGPYGRLRDLIIAGRATPSRIVSHELPLTAAPSVYDKFDKRLDGYTKVILHPAAASLARPGYDPDSQRSMQSSSSSVSTGLVT